MRTPPTGWTSGLRGLAVLALFLVLPTLASEESVVIRADRVFVRPGEVVEDAAVLVQRGRIVAVGRDVKVPDGAREIRGEVVCAGFIDPWSSFAMDPGSVADDNTSAATRSADALDPYVDPKVARELLKGGVTVVRTQAGRPARHGGFGALFRVPFTGEDDLLLDDCGMAMNPSRGRDIDVFGIIDEVDRVAKSIAQGADYVLEWIEYRYELQEWQEAIAEKEEELEKDFKKAKKKRDKELAEAEEEGKKFKEKRYKEDRKPRMPRIDDDKAALGRVAEGVVPLIVEANGAPELRELLAATEEFGRLRMMIAGGAQAMTVADELAERRIPVIVTPSLATADERFAGAADPALAGRLAEADVPVLIASGGRSPVASRDLALLAGLAIGHGLEREEAFEALTLGAARALDVADRLGSVERGKHADLLVLDGDPLASTTRVRYVLSNGHVVLSPEDE